MDLAALYNMALSDIGSTATVTGAGDVSKAGVQCDLWFPVARDVVLRAYPWPFAMVTATLVRAAYTAPDWAFAYAYPDDCLKALEVLSPAGRNPPSLARIAWTVRAAPPGPPQARYILTDLCPWTVEGAIVDEGGCGISAGYGGLNPGTVLPCLRYIAKMSDPEAWPPEVCVAMAWQLAAYLAMPLAMAKELKAGAEQEAARTLAAAVALNLNEQQRDPPRDADPQRARR